jgi:hypothetical protein
VPQCCSIPDTAQIVNRRCIFDVTNSNSLQPVCTHRVLTDSTDEGFGAFVSAS